MEFPDRHEPKESAETVTFKTQEQDGRPINFIGILYKVSTTRDGGSRVVFDCGAESLAQIQRLQTANSDGEIYFGIVCVPCESNGG